MDNEMKIGAELSSCEGLAACIDEVNRGLSGFMLDLFLGNTPMKDFPIVGTIAGIAKAGLTIRDYVFYQKTIKFAQVSEKVDPEKKAEFVKKIKEDRRYRTKVGEAYISMIDRARSLEDAEKVALLSNACVEGNIDYDDFLRCANVVLSLSSGSIREFVLLDAQNISETAMDELVHSGVYRTFATPTRVNIKDEEQLKQEAEAERIQRGIDFSPKFELKDIFPLQEDPFQTIYSQEKVREKYHAETSGGKIDYKISKIGEIIKEVLADYYVED